MAFAATPPCSVPFGRCIFALLLFATLPLIDASYGVGNLSISLNYDTSCALARIPQASTSLWCWGENDAGQLGIGTLVDSFVPVEVPGMIDAIQVASGEHTCAVLSDTTVSCWGRNHKGQLGGGFLSNYSLTHVKVLGLVGVVHIAVGKEHTCAVMSDTTAKCFGGDFFSQLGSNAPYSLENPVPLDVINLVGAAEVHAGLYHTCALMTNAAVYCWGWNRYGQIGIGATCSPTCIVEYATLVPSLEGVVHFSAGEVHNCALLADGKVMCFGWNDNGQLGLGSTTSELTPKEVSGFYGAVQLGGGYRHTCALMSDATMKCSGNVGIYSTPTTLVPREVPELDDVVQISTGHHFTCAVLSNTTVMCFGDNVNGQLGINSTNNSENRPMRVLPVWHDITIDTTLNVSTDQPLIVEGDLFITSNATTRIILSGSSEGPAIIVAGCVSFGGSLVVDASAVVTDTTELDVTIAEYGSLCDNYGTFASAEVVAFPCSDSVVEENYGPTSLNVVIDVERRSDCGGGDDTDVGAIVGSLFTVAVVFCVCAACFVVLFVLTAVCLASTALAPAVYWWRTQEVRKLSRDHNNFIMSARRGSGRADNTNPTYSGAANRGDNPIYSRDN